jgi:hypothetical protein
MDHHLKNKIAHRFTGRKSETRMVIEFQQLRENLINVKKWSYLFLGSSGATRAGSSPVSPTISISAIRTGPFVG